MNNAIKNQYSPYWFAGMVKPSVPQPILLAKPNYFCTFAENNQTNTL